MGQMLTVKQVAEVKGCGVRYIQQNIKSGKLQAQEVLNDKNRKTYLVPLEALDEELQQKWYQMNLENPPEEISTPEPVTDKKAVDHFSESERQEIDFWISLVEQWQQYRMKPGVTCKADVDKKFVTLCGLEYPDKEISVDILYRKWKAVKENDLDGLIDKRGKWKKGTSSIDDTIWQAFLYFYLDESQHPIQKCLDYTKMWAQEKRPDLYTDIPSYSAFYRRLNNEVPEGVKVLGREGHKAYNDRCAPFIRRIYEDIESNEWWIADNHTFDVMVKDKNGNIHRPYLTAFLDARSGIFTGFHITYNPCSEATLIALRKGILKYGIPDNIYVDNGREFLTFDIGGLGHRKKKPKDGEEKFEPPGVFKRLGINMTNAIVRNAKAKIIERRFEDVKNDLSRLFNTYTGGSVVEKPERLKFVLKKEQIYTDEEFEEYVTAVLEWYFNMEADNGAVEADKGKCKIQESATDGETESATVPSYTVTELNKEMQATQNAMTYENPDGNTEVSGVKKDEVIAVIGKVDDTDWYQIDHEGFKSFIDGAFLKEIEQQPKQQTQQQQAQAPVPEQTQPPVQTPTPAPEQTPTPEQTQPPVQTPTPVPTPAPDVYVDSSSGYAEGYIDPTGKVLQKGGIVTEDGNVVNPGDEICPGLTFDGVESTDSLDAWLLTH